MSINKSQSQCLITGVYRSGTEFVAQLLSGHPRLSTTMYHVNAFRFIRNRYEPLSDIASVRRAVSATAQRLNARYGLILAEDRVVERFERAGGSSCAALYDAVMTELWVRDERNHWAEKCQLLWREIPEFIADMPNGRAILVLRDPRSTLASFKHYTYAPSPAYLGAIFNCVDAFRCAQMYRQSLPRDRLLVARFEDAASNPQETAERMLRFLGLDPEEATYDRSQWRNERGENWTSNTAFSEPFEVEKAITRWRTVLSGVELALTEEVCGDVMRVFDYEPEGAVINWPEAQLVCRGDRQVAEWLERWRTEDEGVEAFPTDPLLAENWEETKKPLERVSRAL